MNTARKLLAARGREVRTGGDVLSPCLSICRMDGASGLCEGCFRTLEEIAGWSALDDAGKRAVWKLIEERALTPALSQREREQGK